MDVAIQFSDSNAAFQTTVACKHSFAISPRIAREFGAENVPPLKSEQLCWK
jgi:hypothetical protein